MIFLVIVIFLSCLYIKKYAMVSESSKTSYSYYIDDTDIIGTINIESINLNNYLMQGLDNTFYFSHNYEKNRSDDGEFFLDYRGDLLKNKNSIIYSKLNNINDINKIKMDDIIKISYLKNNLCYQVINCNKYDLLLKIYDKNSVINIFAKKITC